ncbi:MAG: hypothetical protein HY706_08455 [Candidatus Hydrogenedentes bacterium]|nr:hypothetical protein [Candidatus Hydrogenedentota bacterium]
MPRPIAIPTWYYQHFDGDYRLETPEDAFGGWKKTALEFSRDNTAVVSMHAWDAGTREQYPGWYRCVPYIPRSLEICREIYPGMLSAVRASDIPLFHVVGNGDYYKDYPGYKHAVALAGSDNEPPDEQIVSDPIRDKLVEFKNKYVFVGENNAEDVRRGLEKLDFPPEAKPVGDEGVAATTNQLFALCKERHVNHLIYCGFAINWCLLLSPGGMAAMSQRGFLCSALRQATVAVENKESARNQLCKEIGLWRVALAFGFVFDVNDFITALKT